MVEYKRRGNVLQWVDGCVSIYWGISNVCPKISLDILEIFDLLMGQQAKPKFDHSKNVEITSFRDHDYFLKKDNGKVKLENVFWGIKLIRNLNYTTLLFYYINIFVLLFPAHTL